MSLLVVQIPERRRLRASDAAAPPAPGESAGGDYRYVTSPDGIGQSAQGEAPAALLPKAGTIVAVLADADVSWHRITMPKAPSAKLRAALIGLLEDELLEDAEDMHLAIAPGATAGQPTWIAAVDRRWLRGELAALARADVIVDRVVPASWPDDPPCGHFVETDGGDGSDGLMLHWAHADGVASWKLTGGLARLLLPSTLPPSTRWSASPAAAAAAEQWLGQPVNVMSPSDRLLQAARSLWNLRQFELAQRTRGARALREGWRRLRSPEWKAVRWGAAVLVAVHVLGLNLWAWQQRQAVAQREAALQALVRATFPRVGELDVRRDPAAVMQREVRTLRTMAGRPGDDDLETMLLAAASAWPAGSPPAQMLRFESGRLTISAAGWAEPQVERFRELLQPAGWRIEAEPGKLTMSRAGDRS